MLVVVSFQIMNISKIKDPPMSFADVERSYYQCSDDLKPGSVGPEI